MRYFLIALLFVSCVSVDKAKSVLNSHPVDAARYCADKFPVHSDSIVTTIRDTIREQAQERDLSGFADSVIQKAYQEKEAQIKAMEDYIDEVEKRGAVSKAEADALRLKMKGFKPVDTAALNYAAEQRIAATVKACEDKTTTVIQENTARVAEKTLLSEDLQKRLNATQDRLNNNVKWKWWLIAILAVLIALRIFKSYIPFLKFL